MTDTADRPAEAYGGARGAIGARVPSPGNVMSSLCPTCGNAILSVPAYVTWCDRCDWNLDPKGARSASVLSPRLQRREQRQAGRAGKLARASFERATSQGPDVDPVRHALVFALATPIHVLTAAVATSLVLLLVEPVVTWLQIVGGLLLAGILWQIRPRLGRPPRRKAAWSPEQAPAAFALVGEVARAAGAPPPHLIVVDGRFNASYSVVGMRRRRVLHIGLPFWNCLDDSEKVALLAHEMGHAVNHDIRRSWYLVTAVWSLTEWAAILRPRPVFSRHRARRRSGGNLIVLENLADSVLAPVAALVWLLSVGLRNAMLRDGQCAEYRADAIAAQVAGRQSAADLARRLMLGDRSINALRFAATRKDADIWAAQRHALAALPAHEIERCERLARRSAQRIDDSHPPSHLRFDYINSLPSTTPSLVANVDSVAAADAEIYRRARVIASLFE